MMVLLLQPPGSHDYRPLYYAQLSCFCHYTVQHNLFPSVHQNEVNIMNKQLPCLIGLLGLPSLEGFFPGLFHFGQSAAATCHVKHCSSGQHS